MPETRTASVRQHGSWEMAQRTSLHKTANGTPRRKQRFPPTHLEHELPALVGAQRHLPTQRQERGARELLETCPISTEGWTRRVHFVREGGGEGGLLEHWDHHQRLRK